MKQLLAIFILLFLNSAQALDWRDNPDIGKLFTDAGVQGTFVLYDVDQDRYFGHDRIRAETRFIPASTFKIANSLIGLSVGAVGSVDEVLPYGGTPQPIKTWEHDMGLREAIKISNVPIYQELARRIGLERMRENLAEMDYGNGEIGIKVDDFWLAGPLKISAVEQTRFLARLGQDRLPFSKEVQGQVREIVKLEQGEGWALYGKTGQKAEIGWWVGWVQKAERLYSFAVNIEVPQTDDPAKRIELGKMRIELGKASLKVLGVL